MRSPFTRLLLGVTAGALAVWSFGFAQASEDAVLVPPPAVDVQSADGVQTAVIAGGCFWGVQGVFQHTAGVLNAVSGYAGGG
ncbi:MAG TPA: peptide-methionine (S)-S-oxide reductase, partial [Rhodopseudomonas sp.]|uniref:peptide-methionine (S)-S-oxide reductase n=1 Tax=Rhodopseudomonas sp. TaxID=1078 RepID=UPI002EDB05DE